MEGAVLAAEVADEAFAFGDPLLVRVDLESVDVLVRLQVQRLLRERVQPAEVDVVELRRHLRGGKAHKDMSEREGARGGKARRLGRSGVAPPPSGP